MKRNPTVEVAKQSADHEMIEKLLAIILEHETKFSIRWCGTPEERLRRILQQYNTVSTQALCGAKSFRDDVIVDLRAIAMIMQMIGDAGTHKEKAARLRGCIELIERQLHSLRETEFNFDRQWFQHEDVFRSDFPTRQLMERIHSLEDELKQYKDDSQPDKG